MKTLRCCSNLVRDDGERCCSDPGFYVSSGLLRSGHQGKIRRQKSYSVKNLCRMQGREQEWGERASDYDAGLRPVKDGGGRGTG